MHPQNRRAWLVIPLACGAAGLGLVLVGTGCTRLGAPLVPGGPMHLDWSPVDGALALAAGVVALEWLPPRVSRSAWAAAIPVVLATAGRAFYAYPPFDDGAYFQLRYGLADGPWPAGPERAMLGLSVLAWAADRAAWPASDHGPWSRAGVWVVRLAAAAASCAAFAWFAGRVDAGAWPESLMLPALGVAAGLGATLPARRIGRALLCHAAVLSLTCLAARLLFALPPAGG